MKQSNQDKKKIRLVAHKFHETPMLYLIFIAPCFIIVDKKFSAFMYHADDDVEVAHNVKDKLEEQNFRIYLSSEVQGFERKTMIIFIYRIRPN